MSVLATGRVSERVSFGTSCFSWVAKAGRAIFGGTLILIMDQTPGHANASDDAIELHSFLPVLLDVE